MLESWGSSALQTATSKSRKLSAVDENSGCSFKMARSSAETLMSDTSRLSLIRLPWPSRVKVILCAVDEMEGPGVLDRAEDERTSN